MPDPSINIGMKLHIFIKKVNLTNFADGRYWGNFERLFEISFNDEQFLKLVEFFQTASDYRSYVQDHLTQSDGLSFQFYTNPNNPLVAFYIFGLVDKNDLNSILRNNDIANTYFEKRDSLFAELGWQQHEERATAINASFNDDTISWSGIPSTFNEVEALYNSAVSIEQYLDE